MPSGASAAALVPPDTSLVTIRPFANVSAYSITPLYEEAVAINNAGQVLQSGESLDLNGDRTGVFAGDVRLTPIYARGFNNAGQIVGDALPKFPVPGSEGEYGYLMPKAGLAHYEKQEGFIYPGGHAFLYKDGTMTDLGSLAGPDFDSPWYATASWANGINERGQIVGMSAVLKAGTSELAGYHAFRYENGHMKDLGTLYSGDTSEARAINSSGQVVGYSETDGQYGERAFLAEGDSMRDLGTLPGGDVSDALAINDAGQVVGWSDLGKQIRVDEYTTRGVAHAFLSQGGTMKDLGTLLGRDDDSRAEGINSFGQVVGSSDALELFHKDPESGEIVYQSRPVRHAFLYQEDAKGQGEMVDLNNLVRGSGWTLEEATGINDRSQIIGGGIDPDGHETGFLLTPNLVGNVLDRYTSTPEGQQLSEAISKVADQFVAENAARLKVSDTPPYLPPGTEREFADAEFLKYLGAEFNKWWHGWVSSEVSRLDDPLNPRWGEAFFLSLLGDGVQMLSGVPRDAVDTTHAAATLVLNPDYQHFLRLQQLLGVDAGEGYYKFWANPSLETLPYAIYDTLKVVNLLLLLDSIGLKTSVLNAGEVATAANATVEPEMIANGEMQVFRATEEQEVKRLSELNGHGVENVKAHLAEADKDKAAVITRDSYSGGVKYYGDPRCSAKPCELADVHTATEGVYEGLVVVREEQANLISEPLKPEQIQRFVDQGVLKLGTLEVGDQVLLDGNGQVLLAKEPGGRILKAEEGGGLYKVEKSADINDNRLITKDGVAFYPDIDMMGKYNLKTGRRLWQQDNDSLVGIAQRNKMYVKPMQQHGMQDYHYAKVTLFDGTEVKIPFRQPRADEMFTVYEPGRALRFNLKGLHKYMEAHNMDWPYLNPDNPWYGKIQIKVITAKEPRKPVNSTALDEDDAELINDASDKSGE